jgi:hypothetical protein
MASARNTESLTQLTEFGALESDRGGGLFSRIFSRKSAGKFIYSCYNAYKNIKR